MGAWLTAQSWPGFSRARFLLDGRRQAGSVLYFARKDAG